MRPEDEADKIKKRVEACVMQATMNANASGGDAATAGADLLTAFVLLTARCGGDPDAALDAMWAHSKVVVADFWPKGPMQ